MKKKILLTVSAVIFAAACACGLAACNLLGGSESDKEQNVVYHLNGGHLRNDADETGDYYYRLYDDEDFTPLNAKKETWVLENWYFDEALTQTYSAVRFSELREAGNDIHLYANWIDQITITKDNFTDFFKVSSRWNGGGTIGNAGITYSISPIVTFDPENSADSFEIEIHPYLSLNNAIVWSGKKSILTVSSEADYSYSGVRAIDSSGAGVQFDIMGKTLDYQLITQSFEMKLLHKVPMNIALDLDGGECEKDTLSVNGTETLLKNSLPTPQKSGYRFMGWFTDTDYKTEYADWIVTRPRTLYAKFVKEITVTYHMNGAKEREAEVYLADAFISLGSDPVRENYKFFGYYTTPNFEAGSEFSSRMAGEEDIDLYARWEAVRTITFQTNGGNEKEAIQVADTEIPNLGDDPFKSALVFYGWYTDEDCTQKYAPSPVDGDLTLYALWMEEVRFSYQNLDAMKEYLEIELKDERLDGVLTLTLTVTIKEKYRQYGFGLMGTWQVNLSNEEGADLGNGMFKSAGSMTLSAPGGSYTVTGVYTANPYYANNNATVFTLVLGISWGYVYIPEGGLKD